MLYKTFEDIYMSIWTKRIKCVKSWWPQFLNEVDVLIIYTDIKNVQYKKIHKN